MFIGFGTKDEDTRKSKVNFTKTRFLSVTEGKTVVVRFLQAGAHRTYTHYFDKATVECLGEDCPICANNKRLIVEYPEDFRDQRGWNSASRRYYTNVLDRTEVKVCPNVECQAENTMTNDKWPATCYACDTFLHEVQPTPSNKVKVFNYGARVKDDLDALSVHPITKKPVDLLSMDIALVASGVGKDKKIKPITIPEQNDKVEVPEDALFELEKVAIKLSPVEMLDLQRGVSLKDIFAARKDATKGEYFLDNEKLNSLSKDTSEELEKKISEMFPN